MVFNLDVTTLNSKTYCIDPLIPGGSNRSHKLEQTSTEHFALSADYYNGQQWSLHEDCKQLNCLWSLSIIIVKGNLYWALL